MLRRERATTGQHARSRSSARVGAATLFAVGALLACGGRLAPGSAPVSTTGGDDAGSSEAGGVCTASVSTDVNNCGWCGNVCNIGDSCVEGVCLSPPLDASLACSGRAVGCGPEQACCEEHCTDPTTDPLNCGGCGVVCTGGEACIESKCGGCYFGQTCTGTQACCPSTGCADVETDPKNCGSCGWQCPTGDACVGATCVARCNEAGACPANETCCADGCIATQSDPANCGGCGVQCGSTATCIDGSCAANEGAFNPTANPTYLTPGGHVFSTINVPAGVTVYVAGAGTQSGTLDLRATGAIEIDGTIDLSGGPGTQSTVVSLGVLAVGRGGNGGFTGEPYASGAQPLACWLGGGNSGALGLSVAATQGTCGVPSTTTCLPVFPKQYGRPAPNLVLADAGEPRSAYTVFTATPAMSGGGAGVFTGFRAYGSGGGGAAGGAPGAEADTLAYEFDCSGVAGGGGAGNGQGGFGGGAPYDGTAGVLGASQCGDEAYPGASVGGGGGGSIGAMAAADLAVTSTFQTGSGGGGGSADYADRPYSGGTSGGGGGGGALKLETTSTITITGQLRANGGAGADAFLGTPATAVEACDPEPGAAGGGGSGGVIYLSAPSIVVASSATISAVGGAGGAQSAFATGGAGGAGGLGRIRLSVKTTTCSLSGTFQPPLASGCQPTSGGKSGAVYIDTYPN
jgi:hypothetical protein